MIAPWYQEILSSEEKIRERLKWLKDRLACKNHTISTRDHQFGFSECYSLCKCGAYKWDSERYWHDMPRDDREKMEQEVKELTTLLAEKGGTYEI